MKFSFAFQKNDNIAKFQADNSDLPKEINLPFLIFSKKWNKNTQNSKFKIDFSLEDLLEPEKTKFIYGHTDGSNEPKENQIIKNTYIHEKKIETRTDKDGDYQVVTGILHSTNPKFIKELKSDKFKGFSPEVVPLTKEAIYFNENDEVYFKQAIMPYLAVLEDEVPAVPSAGIIGKFSKKDFGYEDIPNKLIFTNLFKNMDEKQLKELITNSVETAIKAKFSEFEKKAKEANIIKLELNKDLTAEDLVKEVTAKFSILEGYELVKKDEEGGDDKDSPEAKAKFAEYQEKLSKTKSVKKVGKVAEVESGEENILKDYFI